MNTIFRAGALRPFVLLVVCAVTVSCSGATVDKRSSATPEASQTNTSETSSTGRSSVPTEEELKEAMNELQPHLGTMDADEREEILLPLLDLGRGVWVAEDTIGQDTESTHTKYLSLYTGTALKQRLSLIGTTLGMASIGDYLSCDSDGVCESSASHSAYGVAWRKLADGRVVIVGALATDAMVVPERQADIDASRAAWLKAISKTYPLTGK